MRKLLATDLDGTLLKDNKVTEENSKSVYKFEKVEHVIPMMSLADVFNEDEIRLFDDRIRKKGIKPELYALSTVLFLTVLVLLLLGNFYSNKKNAVYERI